MRGLIALVLIVLAASLAGADDTLPVLYARLDLAEGRPCVDSTFTLHFGGAAFYDLEYVSVMVEVPTGMTSLADSTKYEFSPSAGDTVGFELPLRVDSAGPYLVRAHMLLSDADTVSFRDYWVTDFYILSADDTAEWSNEPLDGVAGYNLQADELVLDENPGFDNYGSSRICVGDLGSVP